MKKVGILGCGWLGFPLGVFLNSKGYTVKGSSTNSDKLKLLEQNSIEAFLVLIETNKLTCSNDSFFDLDVLVINFPPGRTEERSEEYVLKNEILIRHVKKLNPNLKIVFISSTSVYPMNSGITDEKCMLTPDKPSGIALLKVERLYKNNFSNVTILRLAGLIGYDRVPAKFLSGKKNLKSGSAPVNLVHRDDCVQIIYEIIKRDLFGKTFNVCSDFHPARKEYYTKAAANANLPLPDFDSDDEVSSKIISNVKLKEELNYSFIYPDPELI